MTFGLNFDYTTIAMLQPKCNQNAIKTQSKIMLHLSCSLIAFQLHFDCMKLLHFDCIFITLHLDCKNITLRLHFHYMTFGLHFDCTTIAMMQSNVIKMQSKRNVTLELQFNCISVTFRLHKYVAF